MAIYGIDLQNTAPGKPRGKLPESIYSALRHIDNAPEFHGAQRSGPNDIPNPNPTVIQADVFEAVLRKRVRDFNTMRDTRAQGVKRGENRDEAFLRLSEGRAPRHVSPLQRRSVVMTWHRRMVMQDGRVKFKDGLFGDATTQDAMLEHEGYFVLIGLDPNDYHAPEVPYLLGNAERIFTMLFKMTAGGFAPDEGELCGLYDLCGRAFKSAALEEGDALNTFDQLLRNLLKESGKMEASE